MRRSPGPRLRHLPPRARHRARGLAALALGLVCLLAPARARAAQPFIWDQDTNGIDDRIQSVHELGWPASFVNSDTTGRQRIEVLREAPGLVYGVYVIWDHEPTAADLTQLALLLMPALARIEAVPATRSLATYAQCEAAAALPGVERVEAVPLLYPGNRDASSATGVRDPHRRIFPTLAAAAPGLEGQGVVVAFLDTGINDEAEGPYPGHEALAGRCLGGALFLTADSLSHTPRSGSVNPADHGGQVTRSHATHVAGTAVGSGGPGGYAAGMAPQARFVDVKVLNDSGFGVAVPEALDWCISNRARDWGSPEPSEVGIDVINLSLSSPDESDGQDLASRLAARAVELGMIVVASMGNDGNSGHVPSPAAGDGVIAVGSLNTWRTPTADDDLPASYHNTGPRASDGDGDVTDELKPDLVAPGEDVLSANGDLLTDGTRWQRLGGTSMAAAVVSGVCALFRQAFPAATPGDIAGWLRATARRPLLGDSPVPPGVDPRWRATRGMGAVDAYAAWLEATGGIATQLRRLIVSGDDTTVTATLWTGREVGVAHLVFERAPDAGGAPGAFAPVDSLPSMGGPSLDGYESVHAYSAAWPVPPSERSQPFWYRAACTVGASRLVGPAVLYRSPAGPRAATLELWVAHDAFDGDLECSVRAGYATDGGPVFEVPGTAEAVASDWLDGTSGTGNQAWSFNIPIPVGAAPAFLPPGPGTPWTLRITDAGSPATGGRVLDFRLVWHEQGDLTYVAEPMPRQTTEGGTIEVSVPGTTLGVGAGGVRGGPRARPNPGRVGDLVRLALPPEAGGEARVFDITGREVARVALAPTAGGWAAEWRTRDARGRALPAGVYLVRGRAGAAARVVLLGP